VTSLTRIDHSVILGLIPQATHVLDLGCGDGSLLDKLVKERGVRGLGIEIDDAGVRDCIAKGLPVLQGDIDEGLRDFPDASFDYVLLNQTIQAAKKPAVVLQEMLRVGRKVIVGFPNFAYWRMRWYLLTKGRMPRTDFLNYEWYDTPNIHFCSIRDFDRYCEKTDIVVEKRIFLSTGIRGGKVYGGSHPNLFAENAVYLLSAPPAGIKKVG
jgi:methionine biosynthesis protein MetW